MRWAATPSNIRIAHFEHGFNVVLMESQLAEDVGHFIQRLTVSDPRVHVEFAALHEPDDARKVVMAVPAHQDGEFAPHE